MRRYPPSTMDLREWQYFYQEILDFALNPIEQVAEGAIGLAQFAANIRPFQIVAALPSLPDATYPPGEAIVFCTADGKLWRNVSDVWTAAVPTSDLTGQITETQITDEAVTSPKIAAGTIVASNIAGETIIGDLIAAGTILSGHLYSGVVEANRIQSNNIAAGAITATLVGTNQIIASSANIANAVITNAHINDLSASKINTGTLNCSLLTVSNLSASSISTGTLSAGYIQGGTLNCSLITVSNLSASSITTGTLSATRISGGTLNCSLMTVSNLSASSISTGTMYATRISGGTLDCSLMTVSNLSASSINTGTLSASRISGGTLNAGTMTVSNLSASSINTGTLNCSQFAVSNLSASALNTGTLNCGLITVSNLTANQISSGSMQSSAFVLPSDSDTSPGAGWKIDMAGGMEAYSTGLAHTFGGCVIYTNGSYMVSIGAYLTPTGLTKRYPRVNATNFTVDGQYHHYRFNTGTTSYEEICNIGLSTSGSDYVGEEITIKGSMTWGLAISDPDSLCNIGVVSGVNKSNSTALYGWSQNGTGGTGVSGGAHYGVGVNAYCNNTAGKTPLVLSPSYYSAAPSHSSSKGSLWVTSTGVLYINTSGSTTWQKVGAQ